MLLEFCALTCDLFSSFPEAVSVCVCGFLTLSHSSFYLVWYPYCPSYQPTPFDCPLCSSSCPLDCPLCSSSCPLDCPLCSSYFRLSSLGAPSASIIQRLSEIASLEGETVRQEKIKKIKKNRRQDS
uniref:Uncharacterized protein n=1 Tax=Oncorhynchus tshawytscha TaxID=74940 RepID=A0A8C8CC02_ONCTS